MTNRRERTTASAIVDALEGEVEVDGGREVVLLVLLLVDNDEELQMFAPGVQAPLPLHVSLMVHGFESLEELPLLTFMKTHWPVEGLQVKFWHGFTVQITFEVPTH